MKALLIHPRLAPMGGLESRLLNYSGYFINHGWEVHIACRKADKSCIKPGMHVHTFPSLFTKQGIKNFKFNEQLKKWKKPEVDFELSLGRTTIQKNILAPASHKGFLAALGKSSLSKDDALQIQMDTDGYHASENIFACSGMVKNELISLYGVQENKIHVLYPPFNADKHKPFTSEEKSEIRKRYGFSSDKIYHLFVSVSHERKGLPLLLEIFKKLKGSPHHLIIIGHKVNAGLSNVTSLGFMEDSRMAYALGDYLLHPALYEPYGQIVNEAIHHQIPVVISNKTGASEIITHETGIVMDDFDVDYWCETILGLENYGFNIPSGLLKNLGIDLATHVQEMLRLNGISL